MSEVQFQVDLNTTTEFLKSLLAQRATEKALDWLNKKVDNLQENYEDRQLFLSFSMASRFFDKRPLNLTDKEKNKAFSIRTGFNPENWDELQTARTILILTIPYQDFDSQQNTLDALFESADVAESVALYTSLPLLPNPELHVKRAAEGIRTNMTVVLDAVVLNNPFPSEFFDEISWNQLILKTIFTERPVYQVYNADKRANAKLASTLSDYAHERWAAGRFVTPELWRFTGRFITETILSDYKKLLEEGNTLEKNAALLACKDADTDASRLLISQYSGQVNEVANNWDDLGKAFYNEKGPLPSGYQQAGSGVSTSN